MFTPNFIFQSTLMRLPLAKSDLGAMLNKCKLIIWDEAPMENKLRFEALDRSLREVLPNSSYDTCDKPLGKHDDGD